MGTLFLINSNPKFKFVVKDRLFYNRFEYAIGFHLDEISCLRELDHDHIDLSIERRKTWRGITQQRLINNNSAVFGYPGALSRQHKNITEKTVSDLHELAEILLTTVFDFKLVVSGNQGRVYTNTQTLIDQLDNLPSLTKKDYSRAVICRPKNTIQLKNPKHQYRSYFKMVKLTDEQKCYLTNFLLNQPTIRISPALHDWIKIKFHRTQDYFFVDHNEMSWLTMLALVHSGLIRKTMQIIPAK
jgi:hypothetical protein